jgi:hypothetical protein
MNNNSIVRKAIAGAALIPGLIVGVMVALASASTPTAESVVTAGAEDVKDQVLAIGLAVVPFGAALLAVTLGWRFAKKFLRG